MGGYTKLFSSIVTSTIWCEDDQTRIVWVTLLAIADAHGRVEASIPGLAHIAHVTVEQCEKAVERLQAPDPHSRTRDHDGRRIEAIDGGWRILNYAKYREKGRSQARTGYMREKKRESRARKKHADVNHVSTNVNQSQPIAEAEAEAEAEETAIAGAASDQPRTEAEPDDRPGRGSGVAKLRWDDCLLALRTTFRNNRTIDDFRQWFALRYATLPPEKAGRAFGLLMELIHKSRSARNPGGWFIGAVKQPTDNGGFGYRPHGNGRTRNRDPQPIGNALP